MLLAPLAFALALVAPAAATTETPSSTTSPDASPDDASPSLPTTHAADAEAEADTDAGANAEADAVDSPSALAEAARDVEIILTDTTSRYLQARARLVRDPGMAARALLDRLHATPPLGPAERKRILDVLAELNRPEDLQRFADELRRAALQASSPATAVEAIGRWRPLLLEQGAAATSVLETLVGDRALPLEARAVLLEDLIHVAVRERLPGYLALLGHGQPTLQTTLGRALEQRAARSPDDRSLIVVALDTALANPTALEPADFASRLRLRLRLGGDERVWAGRLEAAAVDPNLAFPFRVAAVDGLDRLGASDGLAHVAVAGRDDASLSPQAREVVVALALERLARHDRAQVATMVSDPAFLAAETPRWATLGLKFAELPPGGEWLARGIENPWPEVRRAALARVGSGCQQTHVRTMSTLVDDGSSGTSSERAVARAALAALGRCETTSSQRALRVALRSPDQHIDLRAEAARQLVRLGGPTGVDHVARALRRRPGRRLERRLAAALRYAPAPTDTATRILCSRVGDRSEVSMEATQTLTVWYADGPDVCPRDPTD